MDWFARILAFLPLLWLASFNLFVVPALWRGEAGRGGVFFPLAVIGGRRGWDPLTVAIPLFVAAIAWFFLRRRTPWLAATLILTHAFLGTVLALGRREWHVGTALLMLSLAAVGFHLLSAEARYARRVGQSFLLFAAPLAVLAGGSALFLTRSPRIFGLTSAFVLGPLLLPLLVGNFRPSAQALRPWPRYAIWLSLLALLLTAGGAQFLDRARQRQRRDNLAAELQKVPPASRLKSLHFQRGVNFTSEGWEGYHPAAAAKLLDLLKEHGVDAVALVPYGSMTRNSPSIRFDRELENSGTYVALANLAHARGMAVMLKPQIWGTDGSYPGDFAMLTEADRQAWFANYAQFVDEYAKLAERMGADLFCVGTEFKLLSRYEEEWRSLLARARLAYHGPLTYAATQGEEFEGIRFWDAVDYIGLNNYYPLPDTLDATAIAVRVGEVAKRYGKPVILPEVGFASVRQAHRAPWAEDGPVDTAQQARCYEAIFRAFYGQPWLRGMYWWKIGTDYRGGPSDGSFTPWGKPAMEVMKRWYRQPRE
ncbi:MAG: hypothetical protein K2X03_23345 [Bryobacteraceae bacterium]|nr:hypothetical protein [Bryobacteraceae bacterium]